MHCSYSCWIPNFVPNYSQVAIVDQSRSRQAASNTYFTIQSAIASGASIIKVKPGTYNENITINNLVLEGEPGVTISTITASTAQIVGITVNSLTTNGTNVIVQYCVVSVVNNGTITIENSKVLSLVNNGCCCVYNSYIFSPIISNSGTLTLAQNVVCIGINTVAPTPSTIKKIIPKRPASDFPVMGMGSDLHTKPKAKVEVPQELLIDMDNVSSTTPALVAPAPLVTVSLITAINTKVKSYHNSIVVAGVSDFTTYNLDNGSTLSSNNNSIYVGDAITVRPVSLTHNSTGVVNNDSYYNPIVPSVVDTTSNLYSNIAENGNLVTEGVYIRSRTITGNSSSTIHDAFIEIESGDLTLVNPPIPGQVIMVKNNGLLPSTVTWSTGSYVLNAGSGAVFVYDGVEWQLVTTNSTTPPPIPNTILVNNTVFVDAVYGNDATAVISDPSKPALTIDAAYALRANPNTVIYVRPGTYTPTGPYTECNFFFMPDTIVSYNGAGTLFGGSSNIYGNGILISTGTGNIINVTNSHIEVTEITSAVGDLILINSYLDCKILELTNCSINTNRSVAEIDAVNIGPNDRVFISTNESSITISTLGSLPYTGTDVNYVIQLETLNSVSIQDIRFPNTCVKNLVSSLSITNTITVELINNIGTLLSGNGNGIFNAILNQSTNSFLLVDGANLQINSANLNNNTGSTITNSRISIQLLAVNIWNSNTITNSTVTIEKLEALASIPIFLLQGDSNLTINKVNMNNSSLGTTSGLRNDIAINSIDTLLTNNIMTLVGQYQLRVGNIDHNGTSLGLPAFVLPVSGVVVPNHIDIGKYVSSAPLMSCTNDNSVNVHIGVARFIGLGTFINATNTTGSLMLRIDNITNNLDNRLLSTNGGTTLFVSGNINSGLSFISVNGVGLVSLHLDDITYSGASNIIDANGGVGSIVDIIIGKLTSTATLPVINQQSGIINVTGNIIDLSNGLLVTNSPNITNIDIDNISASNLVNISGYNDGTLANINVSTGSFSADAVVISGNSHLPTWNAGIKLTGGTINTNGGAWIVSNGEYRIFSTISLCNTIGSSCIIITGYGTYTRVSGKYNVGTAVSGGDYPVITLNPPTISASITLQAIQITHAELTIGPGTENSVILANVNYTGAFTTTANYRIFSVLANGINSSVVTGGGTYNIVNAINPLTIYNPLVI